MGEIAATISRRLMRPSLPLLPMFLALLGLAGRAAPAAAQSAVQLHGAIAVGAAPGQGRSGPGFAVLGSAEAERAGSPLWLRGELLFTQSSHDVEGYMGASCYGCSALVPYSRAESTEQGVGALLGATYRLSGARGRARTYLIGGLGLYRTQTVFEGSAGSPCPPGAMCLQTLVEPYSVRETRHDYGAGGHVGVGGAIRMGTVDLTAEARLHLVDSGIGSRRLYPLTLGVRF